MHRKTTRSNFLFIHIDAYAPVKLLQRDAMAAAVVITLFHITFYNMATGRKEKRKNLLCLTTESMSRPDVEKARPSTKEADMIIYCDF